MGLRELIVAGGPTEQVEQCARRLYDAGWRLAGVPDETQIYGMSEIMWVVCSNPSSKDVDAEAAKMLEVCGCIQTTFISTNPTPTVEVEEYSDVMEPTTDSKITAHDSVGMDATHRCDRCGGQAYVKVTVSFSDEPFLFCRHHFNDHEEKFLASETTVMVDDYRPFLLGQESGVRDAAAY